MKLKVGPNLLPWLLVIAVAIYFAHRGGGWVIFLLLLPYAGWMIYRELNPGPPKPASPKYTEAGNHRVVLQLPGKRPISVVAQIRRTTGLPLPDATKLVESAPTVVVEGLSEKSAQLVANKLSQAGAKAMAAPIGDL